MASAIAELVGVDQVTPGKDEYASTSLPVRMGNAAPIAYGGSAISVAVHAAAKTVPTTHKVYSVVGHFHGPASLDRKFKCTVTRTRDTRTFATRRVSVTQLQRQPDGRERERTCVELIADFHASEAEETLMTYAPPPLRRGGYAAPHDSPSRQALSDELVRAGQMEPELAGAFAAMFSAQERFFDLRFCRAGMSGQNLGVAKRTPTDQDALPITARTSAEWYRVRGGQSPRDHGERSAAVAFLMDGGLAFLPLVHDHLGFEDAGAASSLDFALRFFVPDVDLGEWHLRERVTHAAGVGRSYSEGRLFDEHGRLVVSMTQQGILRPLPKKARPAL
ncbi:hypothetical protein DL766_004953 [Monosporascus sp. MC13-8B]|uniref:Acyl-CoA thioesterase II n=1 Tax=Monosporascus cannonballus TaxID=155416 RepID=A0ABY0H287_9PEZI|nr:hypothetical protein DL762_006376 [Monosporascus cannonballus]RYO97015.1 hypothetical protein DL763_002952 [Monosporascus cannonballus]RYP30281.1 hypothetical protein DL766_004953 [Monosporascus sp. MC13-8B]